MTRIRKVRVDLPSLPATPDFRWGMLYHKASPRVKEQEHFADNVALCPTLRSPPQHEIAASFWAPMTLAASMMAPKPAPRRSLRNEKKQTRLSFSPLPSSPSAKASYNSPIRDQLANVRFDVAASSPRRAQRGGTDGADTLPTPESSSHPYRSAEISPSPTSSASDLTPDKAGPSDEDEDDLVISMSKRRKTTWHPSGPLGTPVRRSGRLQSLAPHLETSQSSERFSHMEVLSRTRHPGVGLSDLGSAETSDEDSNILASQPTQRRRKNVKDLAHHNSGTQKSRAGKKDSAPVDDWLVGDDEVAYMSSDEGLTAKRRKSQNDRSPQTPRRSSRKEREELEADLEDLQGSEQEKSARKTRTRGGPVTSERDKAKEHFDMLKRRRAGEKIPRIYDSDEDYDEGGNLIGRLTSEISDEGSIHSSIDTDPESEGQGEEDDFIEDDTSGRLDRLHPDIPLEFTHFASARPRELFPHIIEWLVKNKLAPAFARHDDIFKLAFDRVDDQVKAQAGSRLISAAWNAEFKYTILARPHMSISALPGLDEDLIRSCDACNKSNRPARYDFVLFGDAYCGHSLEPVDNSDQEDDGDAVEVERDESGHQLASRDRHFYLGSHCVANAQMGHKLTHWKYHLNESVLAYLEEQGVLSAEAIVARDKRTKKKREKEAEGIVDSMGEIGKIEELWKDFQNDLNDARLGMEDFQKVGGRSYGRIGVIRSSGPDGRIREWSDNKYKETVRIDSDSDA